MQLKFTKTYLNNTVKQLKNRRNYYKALIINILLNVMNILMIKNNGIW